MDFIFPGNVEAIEFARKRRPMSASTKKKISLALKGTGIAAGIGGIGLLTLKNRKQNSSNNVSTSSFKPQSKTPPTKSTTPQVINLEDNFDSDSLYRMSSEFGDLKTEISGIKARNIASGEAASRAKDARQIGDREEDLDERRRQGRYKRKAISSLKKITGRDQIRLKK